MNLNELCGSVSKLPSNLSLITQVLSKTSECVTYISATGSFKTLMHFAQQPCTASLHTEQQSTETVLNKARQLVQR